MIRKAIRQNRKSKIIVTGCYAQSDYEDLQKIEGISLIAGNGEKNEILQQLEKINLHDTVIRVNPAKYLKKYDSILKNKSSSLHTRALLKIQKMVAIDSVLIVRFPMLEDLPGADP
jgi:threonylcarbamoyladenosine tRNA methylthiotransferase MtaB